MIEHKLEKAYKNCDGECEYCDHLLAEYCYEQTKREDK